jgi:hypothetical protein
VQNYVAFGFVFGVLVVLVRWALRVVARKLARRSDSSDSTPSRRLLIGIAAVALGALVIAVPPGRSPAATNAVVSFLGFGLATFGVVASRGSVGWWLSTTLAIAAAVAYFLGHFLIYWARKPDAVRSLSEVVELFLSVHLDRLLESPSVLMLLVASATAFLSVPRRQAATPAA